MPGTWRALEEGWRGLLCLNQMLYCSVLRPPPTDSMTLCLLPPAPAILAFLPCLENASLGPVWSLLPSCCLVGSCSAFRSLFNVPSLGKPALTALAKAPTVPIQALSNILLFFLPGIYHCQSLSDMFIVYGPTPAHLLDSPLYPWCLQ